MNTTKPSAKTPHSQGGSWSEHIRQVENFPQKGILFQDLTPVFAHSEAFEDLIKDLLKIVDLQSIECFAGIESRGFILASAMAAKTKKGLILLRKAGKLPPPLFQESYELEYGRATLEMNPGSGRICLVDDVLATGGTIQAAIRLSQRAGYEVKDVCFVMNLRGLNKFSFNGQEPKALISEG